MVDNGSGLIGMALVGALTANVENKGLKKKKKKSEEKRQVRFVTPRKNRIYMWILNKRAVLLDAAEKIKEVFLFLVF
jgi:hypothetical protein